MKKYWKFVEKIWNFVNPEYICKRPTRTKRSPAESQADVMDVKTPQAISFEHRRNLPLFQVKSLSLSDSPFFGLNKLLILTNYHSVTCFGRSLHI